MYWNRMKNFNVFWVIMIWLIGSGEGTCSFPFSGTWHSSNYDSMVFSSSGLYISGLMFTGTSIVGSGWECYLNSGNRYVAKTNITITLNTGGTPHYVYTCFVFTSVNAYSYYYYQNTPAESLFGNERIVAYTTGTTVTSDDVCRNVNVPSAAEYNVMVQSGQELNAKTNIGEVMFANFHYLYNDGVSDKCGTGTSQSMLTICTDRQTLTFDYTKCSDLMMYSSGGVLGSVATIVSGSTYYTTVYNFDSTVDGVDTFRFTCIAAATSGAHVSATILPKSCTASQSPTVMPANGGIFTLVANSTCALTPTVDNSDGVDLAPIIGGIIGAIVLIAIIVILLCIRHHKIKRRKQEIIDKRMKIWKIRSTEDDFYDDDFLNETSMKLDCSQSDNPELPVLKSSSSGTKLSQRNQKDPAETDSFATHLEQRLENPMREKSFHVETHRNKDKISDLLSAPGKRTEHMPWKTGRSANIMEYSLERGFPSKPGSKTSRSYTTLQSKQSTASSEFGSMYPKNRKYSRSALDLNRSLTAAGNQFKSESNVYAKVKSLTEKSLSRELTAIKEVPRKPTPNYMKPIRSKTAISINKERAKSRHSLSRRFDSKSRILITRNKSRMHHDSIPTNIKGSRKAKTPREQVMSRAKSKLMRENTKSWRVAEKMMPNPTPADEKSFVQSLRSTYPPLKPKKKKKPNKTLVKKVKTPYGIVHVDVSQKRTTSIMSLDHLKGLVHVERRKVPSRSQVDVIHRNSRSKTMIVDGTWIAQGFGIDGQKGAKKSTDSEYYSSTDELILN